MIKELHFVSGAPGAGKSTAVASFIALKSAYLALDIDSLADSAGMLADKHIYSDPDAWKPYSDLWFDILYAICRNGVQPIFFCPNTPSDIDRFGKPAWCRKIHWLLLDCDDSVRLERLSERKDWSAEQRDEAIDDATELRTSISNRVNTGALSPDGVAKKILSWVESTKRAD